jgi:ankyrin repeat protein
MDLLKANLDRGQGAAKVITPLIEKGAAVNEQDISGYSALTYAAVENNLEVAKLLIDNKANVGVRDKKGASILKLIDRQIKEGFWEGAKYSTTQAANKADSPMEAALAGGANAFATSMAYDEMKKLLKNAGTPEE